MPVACMSILGQSEARTALRHKQMADAIQRFKESQAAGKAEAAAAAAAAAATASGGGEGGGSGGGELVPKPDAPVAPLADGAAPPASTDAAVASEIMQTVLKGTSAQLRRVLLVRVRPLPPPPPLPHTPQTWRPRGGCIMRP